MKLTHFTALATGVAASLVTAGANAQSADALVNKLLEKGILTQKEAEDLKKETNDGFSKAYSSRSGMPSWVTGMKFNGDFRGRAEDFGADNSAFNERFRYRYRLRLGVLVTMKDVFDIGFRLASGDPLSGGGSGGNPLSANTTLQDGASRKNIYIDTAFARWNAIHTDDWKLTATIGKMDRDQPLEISNMVLDYDYNPEGAALQAGYNINKDHALKLNGVFFALDEFNQGALASRDPYMFGGQLIWKAKWTKQIESDLGISAFSLAHKDNLTSAAAPNQNDGNSRDAVTGGLMYNYNPIIGSAGLTFKAAAFPGYREYKDDKGEKIPFPIRFGGEYMENPGAPGQNVGYNAGVTFGKAGKKGWWELAYRYQRLEADAWYEEFVDDDNGAFYQNPKLTHGFGSGGWRGGTNIKGHFVKASYSVTDSLTAVASFYLDELVTPDPTGSISAANHFLFDLNWKF